MLTHTDLMKAGMVAAGAAVFCTSGGIGRDGIGGVCQLLPEPPVNILLHKRIDEKTGESVQCNNRLHQEKTLHFEEHQYSLEKKSREHI